MAGGKVFPFRVSGEILSYILLTRPAEFSLNLEPGEDEDLLRKVRKKKPLGFILVRITLSPICLLYTSPSPRDS